MIITKIKVITYITYHHHLLLLLLLQACGLHNQVVNDLGILTERQI